MDSWIPREAGAVSKAGAEGESPKKEGRLRRCAAYK